MEGSKRGGLGEGEGEDFFLSVAVVNKTFDVFMTVLISILVYFPSTTFDRRFWKWHEKLGTLYVAVQFSVFFI